MPKSFYLLTLSGAIWTGIAAAMPIPNQSLTLSTEMRVYEDLGYANSTYNPRNFSTQNFVGQLALGDSQGIVRYPVGSSTPGAILDFANSASNTETRMWAPMDGGTSTMHVLLAGGSNQAQFSRLEYGSLQNRILAGPALRPESFDWVDDNVIVFTSYEPALRGNIYLASVQSEPFTVALNHSWSPDGFVATQAERIRNIRVGDVYRGYAYYGESQTAANARFWALDLATGVSTHIGTLPAVTGSGSWGLWTVKEVAGFLYVHTTDDGVYVYEMESATTLGPLATHYSQLELETVAGHPGPFWGFDVVGDGGLMLLAGYGSVFELSANSLPGDYNWNGTVDAADYVVWRQNLGRTGSGLDADGNRNGAIDVVDYDTWRAHFGQTSSRGLGNSANPPVPEPETLVMFTVEILAIWSLRRTTVSVSVR